MKRTLLALLLSCAALLTAASAQRRKAKGPCDDPQTQYEMNVCAKNRFVSADALLNRVYKQLASKLEGDLLVKLKAAEASWLKYRDDNCDYEGSIFAGGSIRPTIYYSCLERATKSRTAELRILLREQSY